MPARFMALLLASLLAPSLVLAEPGDQTTALALADIRPAAEASVLRATQLLLGQTPGVLTTQIPGGPPVTLTATGVDPDTGVFTFVAEGPGAASVQDLLSGLTEGGARFAGLSLGGTLDGQAVQLVVLGAQPGPDGSGALRLLLAFD